MNKLVFFKLKEERLGVHYWVQQILSCLFYSAVICVLLFILATYCLNLKSYEVMSGSMEPVLYKSDVIYEKSFDSYELGDIITWANGNTNITHRIVFIYDIIEPSKEDLSTLTKFTDNETNQEYVFSEGNYYLIYDYTDDLSNDYTFYFKNVFKKVDGTKTIYVYDGNEYTFKSLGKDKSNMIFCFAREVNTTDEGSVIITKGDNNAPNEYDKPITINDIKGKVMFTLQGFGNFVAFLKQNVLAIILVILNVCFIFRIIEFEWQLNEENNKFNCKLL